MSDVKSLFLDYLKLELNRAPLTIEAYKNDITQFEEWISPGQPENFHPQDVTSSDVRAWLASRAKNGDTPRTLRRKVITLRTLFKWMLKTGLVSKSPVRDVPLPKIPKPLPDIIKPEEIEFSLEKIKDENKDSELTSLRDFLVVEMLYTLGLRRAELAGIDDDDISFDKGELKVTGKRSKQRIVPLPQKLMEKIKEWQKVRDKSEELENDRKKPLFIIKGKRISHSQIYHIVNKALSSTSARKKSPHALRHSFASGMLNGGAEIDSVREFLGHASLATTQIYTHISLKEIKKAYGSAHPRANALNTHEK